MKSHVVEIRRETVPDRRGRGRVGYTARCSCGWKGRRRTLRVEAGDDAGMHRLEVSWGRPAAGAGGR